jgi:hypothetical protein
MKNITQDQIKAVLQTIYQTNITAQVFDQLSKFFQDLPEVKEKEDKK